jgi:hypothetical protein
MLDLREPRGQLVLEVLKEILEQQDPKEIRGTRAIKV